MPATSVNTINDSAFNPPAIAAAARSALTFKPLSAPISLASGEITGVNFSSNKDSIKSVSTLVTSPTRPNSAGVPSTILVMRIPCKVFPSRPEIPAALTPDLRKLETTLAQTSPAKTLWTISKISGVVTRNPPIL